MSTLEKLRKLSEEALTLGEGFTSFSQLTDRGKVNRPYGFWISPAGKMVMVGRFGHDEAAEELIAKGQAREIQNYEDGTLDVYGTMFASGWVRVVFSRGALLWEASKNLLNPKNGKWEMRRFKPSRKAMQTIEDIAALFGTPVDRSS